MNELLDFVGRIRTAPEVAGVEAAFQVLLRSHGIGSHTYFTVRSRLVEAGRRPVLTDFPADWVARYTVKRYDLIDPVIAMSLGRMTPFTWSDVVREAELGRKQKVFMHEAADCGLRTGLTVPIYGPNGDFAVLSVASEEDPRQLEPYIMEIKNIIHLASLYVHENITMRLMKVADSHEQKINNRERECLLWVARGKTSWEISQILNISEGTVTQYIKSAIGKLSVRSRAHAVAKAIMCGLIHP